MFFSGVDEPRQSAYSLGMATKRQQYGEVRVRRVPIDLVRALDAEGRKQDRSREAQMRFILAERYNGASK